MWESYYPFLLESFKNSSFEIKLFIGRSSHTAPQAKAFHLLESKKSYENYFRDISLFINFLYFYSLVDASKCVEMGLLLDPEQVERLKNLNSMYQSHSRDAPLQPLAAINTTSSTTTSTAANHILPNKNALDIFLSIIESILLKTYRPGLCTDWSSPIFCYRILSIISRQTSIEPKMFQHGISASKFMLRSTACILLYKAKLVLTSTSTSSPIALKEYDKNMAEIIACCSSEGVMKDSNSIPHSSTMSMLVNFSGLLTRMVEYNSASQELPVSCNSVGIADPYGFDVTVGNARLTDVQYRTIYKSILERAIET